MPQDRDFESLIASAIGHGFHLHATVGLGLLESAYEAFLADECLIVEIKPRAHTAA